MAAGAALLYDWLLAFHILLAALWMGGLAIVHLLVLRARGARDDRLVEKMLDETRWIRVRVVGPAAALLLAMGFALVIVGEWGLTTGWVAIGLVGFGASLAISTIATRLDTRQSLLAARAELAILAVVILDMAIKPRL